jgi:membrane associated rhomboid family serine protease
MFNVPSVVVATIVALVVVQLGREFLLSPEGDIEFLIWFAFIPARYVPELVSRLALAGGLGADIWTFVTYALIHGGWLHLGVNSVWLLPFGTVVARRFGGWRYLLFFAVMAAAGAGAHLLTNWGAIFPMVGASAAISGFMAAATRFAFQPGGPLDSWRHHDPESYRIPAAPLAVVLRNPRVFSFLGIWFGLNLLLYWILPLLIGGSGIPGSDQPVAWQAHIGGFLAGLLLFPLFDPIRPAPTPPRES